MKSSQSVSRRKFLKSMVMASSAAAMDWTCLKTLTAAFDNKKNIPVVVIGAGLGGLVSAAYLAKFGCDVTLLEQHDIPGGYATSFDRGNFTFDVSLHATVAEHGWPQRILMELGIWDQLEIAYTPELKRIVTPDFDITLPAKDPDGVKKVLSVRFPHEQKGIHSFYTQMEAVISELIHGETTGPSILDQLEAMTLAQWMALHVTDPDVKYCMAAFCGFYGLPPDRINALFYAVATGEYLVHGGQYYKTRSQNLSNTLANHIKKLNGKIKYRTQVEKIIFNDHNQIEGVLDQAGKKYPAQAVIANCSVPTLINQMIDKQQVPDTFKTQINNQKSSLSAVNLWLGLDKKPAGYTSYSTHLSGRAPAMNDFDSSNDMAESSLGIVLYDNLFNGYSMPGKATMSIVCLSDYSPWKQFETDYFNGRKDDYNKEKQRLARRFIQRVESRLIPGLSGMIEEMEMGTPLTNVYYTKNPAGSIYGFDHDKPHLKAETPIKGLYLASAWSHGGGYTPVMMAGRDAAKMVLKKQFV